MITQENQWNQQFQGKKPGEDLTSSILKVNKFTMIEWKFIIDFIPKIKSYLL